MLFSKILETFTKCYNRSKNIFSTVRDFLPLSRNYINGQWSPKHYYRYGQNIIYKIMYKTDIRTQGGQD
jgi:hypothetical protein